MLLLKYRIRNSTTTTTRTNNNNDNNNNNNNNNKHEQSPECTKRRHARKSNNNNNNKHERSPVVEYTSTTSFCVRTSPVVESVAQCHAPVFPLSPDASDMSSPEDVYTSSWVSLPVPIKTCTTDVSAGAEGQACETPTVMHGRGLPAVSRDMVVSSQWLRKEAARQGYAWRQRRRAQ